jgi:hypothetical protein
MRNDGEFLKDLRQEINADEERRCTYIRHKLTFVISFLGLGSISLTDFEGVKTWPLLYIAPVVALIFDLYIIGETFSIRRSGIFIRYSPKTPSQERLWEECVSDFRAMLPRIAGLTSSGLVLLASALGLWQFQCCNPLYYVWFVATLIIIICVWQLDRQGRARLEKFKKKVKKQKEATD